MADKLIYGEEERLLPWAAERIGVDGFKRDAYSIGLERNDVIVAVCVYENFSKFDCSMHCASDGSKRWMSKAFLLAAFAYPFTQLGMRRISTFVPAKNKLVLEFDRHIGWVQEGVCRKCIAGDGDMIILGMLREECRFIEQGVSNGQ